MFRIGGDEKRGVDPRVIVLPCPPCAEVLSEESKAEAAVEASRALAAETRRRAEEIERIVRAAGVPEEHGRSSFETFDATTNAGGLKAAREFADAFLSGRRPKLYLFSEREGSALACGVGKTHLAAAIVRAVLVDPRVPIGSVRFVEWAPFLRQARVDPSNTWQAIQALGKPDLLVWDDFGANKATETTVELEYDLFLLRRGKADVWTSNFGLAALVTRDTTGEVERITSRIAGRARVLRLSGEDKRRRKTKGDNGL